MGATEKKHNSNESAIGIDLGTTYSCVGCWKDGGIEIVPNDQGNRITPSYVAFTDKERFIGDAAFHLAASNPHNTIFDAKRLIGRNFSDETVQMDMKLWPFKIVGGKDNRPMICVTYKGEEKQFAAEEISSMVLMRIKQMAETFIGSEVKSAVVTVPAYFDQSQRQATMDAGEIAGIKILQLIAEPTAAAIAYGLQIEDQFTREKRGRSVLIFDLGGGTFDVSVLEVYKGLINVRAICGDTHLGGEDFDNRVVNHYVKEFKNKHKKDISGNPKSLRRLRTACERAKRTISSLAYAKIEIDALFEGIDFSATLTRPKFEELNLDLFKMCMDIVTKCLNDAVVRAGDVDDIVLVGGSSRIPKVQKLLQNLMHGKELCSSINPDEAVAYGAAVQAAILGGHKSKKIQDLAIHDVTPLSLGIEIAGKVMCVMIRNNSPIPTEFSHGFTTNSDNQTEILVKVYEGERTRVTENRLLGQFLLTDIQLAPRKVPKITVKFDLSTNGILKVSARDRVTCTENNIIVKSGRLSSEEIQMMRDDAEKFMVEDKLYRAKNLARNNLMDYVFQMRDAINTLSCPIKRNKVEDAVNNAFRWLDTMTHELAELHEYEDRMNALVNLWKQNSQRSMFRRFAKLFGH